MHVVPKDTALEKIPTVIEQQQKKTNLVGQVTPQPGHKAWELCLKTLEFDEVFPEVTGVNMITKKTERRLQVKDGHIYCFALNKQNAEKRFIKMLHKLAAEAGYAN